MAVRITLKYDNNGIKSAVVKIEGTQGPACLLQTGEIQRLNKNSLLTPHEELYAEQEEEIVVNDSLGG